MSLRIPKNYPRSPLIIFVEAGKGILKKNLDFLQNVLSRKAETLAGKIDFFFDKYLGQEQIFELASIAKEFIVNQSSENNLKSVFDERMDRKKELEQRETKHEQIKPKFDQDFQIKA